MHLRRLSLVSLIVGVLLFGGGVGMRTYAALQMAETERRLIAARPDSPTLTLTPDTSPAELRGRTGIFTSPPDPLSATSHRDGSNHREGEKIVPNLSLLSASRPAGRRESHGRIFVPANGPPTSIRLPDLGLWNVLEPVTAQVTWQGGDGEGEIVAAWDVRDAGWHVPTGWPGRGHNVVIAGHSPSRDPGMWSRSIFRQLAYLNPGDPLELTAGSRVYTYRVTRVFAIPERDAGTAGAVAWIDPGEHERLTLITCWPPHTAAYRVLVIADPVSSREKNRA